VIGIAVIFLMAVRAYYQTFTSPKERVGEGKVRILASFYPLAYFSEQIGGEKVIVNTLIPYNTEVHSWQPSISDMANVEEADIIVYNGAGLDHWLEADILPAINTAGKIIVDTTEGIKLLKMGEGSVESEEEHEHGMYDPHTWISPYIARQQAEKIYDALVEFDDGSSGYYESRWQALSDRLEELDMRYLEELGDAGKKEIFTTHAAFGYLADRYGFEQHGVIGVSADEQPSPKTLSEIADLMEEKETYIIFVDPIYSDEYAQTLKSELESRTGRTVQILKLYFMLGPMDELDYMGQIEANLESLKIGQEAD
jgi:zinc transport system substrate-binding protein